MAPEAGMFSNRALAIGTTIRSISSNLLLSVASTADSWLSVPGNPLMRWPSMIGPPILTDSGAPLPSPLPAVELLAASEDSATISHILLTTTPATLDSALLCFGVAPSPPVLQSLPLSDLPPASLLALSRWGHPHLVSLIDLLARSRAFDSAWSLLLDATSAPLPAFVALFCRYSRVGNHITWVLSQNLSSFPHSICYARMNLQDENNPPPPPLNKLQSRISPSFWTKEEYLFKTQLKLNLMLVQIVEVFRSISFQSIFVS